MDSILEEIAMESPTMVDIGLFVIVLAVLIGPFMVKKIEHNLEAFLFVMGVLTVTISSSWHMELIEEALMEPIIKGIVPAVLVAGTLFYYGRSHVQKGIDALLKAVPLKVLVLVIVVILGLASSIITAIIASLLLVELVNAMPLDRSTRINIVIIACFSIGLGAVLTPVGEPLSTIAITKLQGEPYQAGFFFLFNKLAVYIITGCVAMGLLSMFFTGKACATKDASCAPVQDTMKDVVMRGVKVYVFVMALLLLGAGMKVIIDKYLLTVPSEILYWVNMISAILDNATLTAAEISPSMKIEQIKAVLMGLLISGGMLIPGNIPNIISANKLSITSKEWAKLGVPLGLILMGLYYVWLFYLPFHFEFNL